MLVSTGFFSFLESVRILTHLRLQVQQPVLTLVIFALIVLLLLLLVALDLTASLEPLMISPTRIKWRPILLWPFPI